MTPFLAVASYVLAKYLIYSGWCLLVGGPAGRPWWRRGFGLGLVRLGVGCAAGGALALAGAHLVLASRTPWVFLAVLLPVRWLEWSLVATLGLGLSPDLPSVLLGPDGRSRSWIAGGILLSFGTDVLAVVTVGAMRALVC